MSASAKEMPRKMTATRLVRLQAKAAVLITLDRKRFNTATIRQADLPFDILTPGAFLRRLVAE